MYLQTKHCTLVKNIVLYIVFFPISEITFLYQYEILTLNVSTLLFTPFTKVERAYKNQGT